MNGDSLCHIIGKIWKKFGNIGKIGNSCVVNLTKTKRQFRTVCPQCLRAAVNLLYCVLNVCTVYTTCGQSVLSYCHMPVLQLEIVRAFYFIRPVISRPDCACSCHRCRLLEIYSIVVLQPYYITTFPIFGIKVLQPYNIIILQPLLEHAFQYTCTNLANPGSDVRRPNIEY